MAPSLIFFLGFTFLLTKLQRQGYNMTLSIIQSVEILHLLNVNVNVELFLNLDMVIVVIYSILFIGGCLSFLILFKNINESPASAINFIEFVIKTISLVSLGLFFVIITLWAFVDIEISLLLLKIRYMLRFASYTGMLFSIILCTPLIFKGTRFMFFRAVLIEEGPLQKPYQRYTIFMLSLLGLGLHELLQKIFFVAQLKSLIMAVFIINSLIYVMKLLIQRNRLYFYGLQINKLASPSNDQLVKFSPPVNQLVIFTKRVGGHLTIYKNPLTITKRGMFGATSVFLQEISGAYKIMTYNPRYLAETSVILDGFKSYFRREHVLHRCILRRAKLP
jgi:hypothetical protein